MINNNLRVIRQKQGISISELSRRTKISRTTITSIEKGNSNPKASTMFAISKELKKRVGEIFFETSVNHELQSGGIKDD